MKDSAFLDILKNTGGFILKGLKKLKSIFLSKKFIEFCLLGCINCFNDSLFSWIAEHFMQKNIAQIVGYLCGLSIAFFITCVFIFKAPPSFKRYIKFIVAYIPNFIIYFFMGFITLNALGFNQFLGTFIAAVAGGPITFIIIWVYTFSAPKTKKSLEDKLE